MSGLPSCSFLVVIIYFVSSPSFSPSIILWICICLSVLVAPPIALLGVLGNLFLLSKTPANALSLRKSWKLWPTTWSHWRPRLRRYVGLSGPPHAVQFLLLPGGFDGKTEIIKLSIFVLGFCPLKFLELNLALSGSVCDTLSLCFFCPTVLTEGGQIWGGDQSPHWQAEGGTGIFWIPGSDAALIQFQCWT